MSLYKFRYYNSNFHKWDEFYTNYKPKLANAECPHCSSHPLMIRNFYKAFDDHCQRYQCPTCEELIDIKAILTESLDDLNVVEITDPTMVLPTIANDLKSSSIAKGLKNSKDKKVKITFDGKDMEVPVIIPQPRNIRYTPEFLEKAVKAMRDTPLSRQNIMTREDDDSFQSECPACGGILYEEVNIIFEYCPWCAQKLNKDFSNTKKN